MSKRKPISRIEPHNEIIVKLKPINKQSLLALLASIHRLGKHI
jgi:hypothetical protein